MEIVEFFFRYSHVSAGVIVLLTGILAIALKPRGNKRHKKIGIIYFYGMLWIFISSLGMNYFRFNFFLAMITVFSFYLCFSAYRTLKRKTPDKVNWVDWVGSIITLLCGISFFIFGSLVFINTQNPFGFLSVFFGGFTIYFAIQDIKIYRKENYDEKMWWYFHHAANMMGSFIAATTAFTVNVFPKFTPGAGFNWVYWILPTIIGVPLLNNIIKKERVKLIKK